LSLESINLSLESIILGSFLGHSHQILLNSQESATSFESSEHQGKNCKHQKMYMDTKK
jgi:hypothetical protein